MRTNKNQRTETLTFRATKDEAAAIREKAKKEGIPMSEGVLGRALSGDDFVSSKRKQEFFAAKMRFADEFQKVKKENEKKGCPIKLGELERSLDALWL